MPLSEEDAAKLGEVRDRHLGERVFLLGNGPSLNKLPLEKLADEYTFGVNRIGLLFDRVSWRPSYWTVTDWRVGPQLSRLLLGTRWNHEVHPEPFSRRAAFR